MKNVLQWGFGCENVCDYSPTQCIWLSLIRFPSGRAVRRSEWKSVGESGRRGKMGLRPRDVGLCRMKSFMALALTKTLLKLWTHSSMDVDILLSVRMCGPEAILFALISLFDESPDLRLSTTACNRYAHKRQRPLLLKPAGPLVLVPSPFLLHRKQAMND